MTHGQFKINNQPNVNDFRLFFFGSGAIVDWKIMVYIKILCSFYQVIYWLANNKHRLM